MNGRASNHCRFLVFVFLLLVFASASFENAFFAPKSKGGDQRVKADEIHPAKEEDFSNLMGMETEECKKGDEECMARRMVDEAHLDYIYTQKHHHP